MNVARVRVAGLAQRPIDRQSALDAARRRSHFNGVPHQGVGRRLVHRLARGLEARSRERSRRGSRSHGQGSGPLCDGDPGLSPTGTHDGLHAQRPDAVDAQRPLRRPGFEVFDVPASADRGEHLEDVLGRSRNIVDGIVLVAHLDARQAITRDRELRDLGARELAQHLLECFHLQP